uniref:Uncharacterized protein n=2 Tax=Oryza glumipatula TaxID=40148 RepID=A0A0D9ZEJ7_9ORYZ
MAASGGAPPSLSPAACDEGRSGAGKRRRRRAAARARAAVEGSMNQVATTRCASTICPLLCCVLNVELKAEQSKIPHPSRRRRSGAHPPAVTTDCLLQKAEGERKRDGEGYESDSVTGSQSELIFLCTVRSTKGGLGIDRQRRSISPATMAAAALSRMGLRALPKIQPQPAATVIPPRLLSHGGLLRRKHLTPPPPPPLTPYRFFSSSVSESRGTSPSPKQESSRAPRQTEEGEELFRMQDEEKLKLLSLINNLKESEAIKREDPLFDITMKLVISSMAMLLVWTVSDILLME